MSQQSRWNLPGRKQHFQQKLFFLTIQSIKMITLKKGKNLFCFEEKLKILQKFGR
jgi:hypothetical protein